MKTLSYLNGMEQMVYDAGFCSRMSFVTCEANTAGPRRDKNPGRHQCSLKYVVLPVSCDPQQTARWKGLSLLVWRQRMKALHPVRQSALHRQTPLFARQLTRAKPFHLCNVVRMPCWQDCLSSKVLSILFVIVHGYVAPQNAVMGGLLSNMETRIDAV